MTAADKVCLWTVAAGYSYFAYSLLCRAGVAHCDGSGCSPALDLLGFRPPFVSNSEYFGNWKIQLLYVVPHITFAFVFTVSAAAANWLVSRNERLRRRFAASFLVSLGLLSLGPLASDVGSAVHLWRSGRWFAWNEGFWMVFHFPLPILLPLALVSGTIAKGTEVVQARTHDPTSSSTSRRLSAARSRIDFRE